MIPDKLALRARLRAERDRFAAESVSAITAPEAFLERLKPDLVVTSYIALGSEADPTQLAAAAVAKGCRLALPRVTDRTSPMRFLAWSLGDPLVTGQLGLRQPGADAEEVTPDIILTPLLGFDARLDRLGQGAGHYDRAFARYPDAWRVGIAWSVQQVPAVPTDIWDVPLHAVITEEGMLCHK
ncbi:5-formyltetrahydrofolate cyclo-ligase [Sphingomonas sp. AOB5]|uniref:5-formyltetrahydrofolate cyclo-ligase n=1 Tax=Sphingomonas sp. AOB5 TaxID=3034017 RepID=UPI0023F68F3D|nr:5-formyltetrahydrofolate cyclo-ligase [Sphingomonas sp. AOB5]MDF7773849.1 5-formyltetrahydrofolate cyclo-ligase [Sphingomonas sp. AOB5]